MDLDESMTVLTPEGLELRLQLAGLGSRFIAGAVDLFIELVLILVVAAAGGALGGGGGGALFVVGAFAILFFYPVAFEVLARGRTPGKRFSQLRVVRDSGLPVDLPASSIRNLMRLIDGPLLLYLPTVISIAVSSRNQRPGDMAAGTVVIREQAPGGRAPGASPAAAAERWDASAVSVEETAAVRRFLDRRDGLEPAARRRLARRLAEGLRPKVTGAPASLDAEGFLEELAAVKRLS